MSIREDAEEAIRNSLANNGEAVVMKWSNELELVLAQECNEYDSEGTRREFVGVGPYGEWNVHLDDAPPKVARKLR